MQITTPGLYRQRNGRKAEVVAVARGIAIGFCDEHEDDATDWKLDGSWIDSDVRHERDIVAVWPAEPLRCWLKVFEGQASLNRAYESEEMAMNRGAFEHDRIAQMIEITPEIEAALKASGIL